jgi:hypothetical protein
MCRKAFKLNMAFFPVDDLSWLASLSANGSIPGAATNDAFPRTPGSSPQADGSAGIQAGVN